MLKRWRLKRQQRILQQLEQEWFIEAVKNCSDGLWTYMDGAIFTSSKLNQRLGYEFLCPEMTDPKWWLKRVHPEDLSQTKNFFEAHCHGAQNIASHTNLRVRHADGHYLWFVTSCDVRKLPSDASPRLMGIVSDVSSYQLHQAHLEADLKEISKKLETKSKFIALLNHELRTPLSSILSATELLTETRLNQNQKKYLGYVSDATQYLLTLINDVLDMEKISAGKLKIEPLEFNFPRWIKKVVCLLEPLARQKHLSFQVKLTPDLPTLMISDPNRLQYILINLINNAIKFTEHGSVTLHVKPVKDSNNQVTHIYFQVDDTGIGIAADQIATLFDDYTQATISIARTHGGTGLGLAICKNLVELMEGEIGVKSLPDQGSTFWFKIPFISPQTSRITSVIPESFTSNAPLKILLAEDNLINQEVVQGYLNKYDDIITVARNGLEAVQLFEAGNFDLILMDINMPDMNGLQAMETIRQSAKGLEIPIIAITANNSVADWQNYCAKGMTKVIGKPVDRETLEDLLAPYRQVCSRKKDRHEELDIKLPLADLTSSTLNRLLELYDQDAKNILSQMRTASMEDLHILAHTLAGMSENIGFMKVGKTARTLMQVTQTQENPQPVIELLHHQVPQSLHFAKELIQKSTKNKENE
jgi:signal transduction histidine kinase/CheY-like chemotaxis protein